MFALFTFIGEAVDVNELLTDVFTKYHDQITNKSSSLCLITPHQTTTSNPPATTGARSNGNQNTMDELNEIFVNNSEQAASKQTINCTPLEPTLINYKPNSNGTHTFISIFSR